MENKILSKSRELVKLPPSRLHKVIHVNCDSFGHLAVVAQSRWIDIYHVFEYELSNVPSLLAHTDGTHQKSSKSRSISYLKVRQIACFEDLLVN